MTTFRNPLALIIGLSASIFTAFYFLPPASSKNPQANARTVYIDGVPQPDISKLATTNYVIAATNNLATKNELGTETNRAQVAERLISDAVVAETNRAQVAEGLISDAVVAETNRAQVAEGLLIPSAQVTPDHLFYVDNQRVNNFTPDGTEIRPFFTVGAAMTAIGNSSVGEWEDLDKRFYSIKVSPGVYVEDVSVAWRPYVAIDLSSAVIIGDLTRQLASGDFSSRVSTLVIRGDSLRSAYNDGLHTFVGITGEVIFEASSGSGVSPFHELHVIDSGISGGVEYKGTLNTNSMESGHIFLRDSQVGAIVSTNGWAGVSLFAYGWGGGHSGGGPAGSGIGSLIGRVLPYNLQSTLISGGMNLQDCFPGINPCQVLWHNVTFETNFIYNVTNVTYGVKLDTASYNSWLEVSIPEERGVWTTDGLMVLSDVVSSYSSVSTNGDYSVLTTDSSKMIVFTGATTNTFSLPSVDASNIGIHFQFVKAAAGKLIIDAADSDKIMDSGAGDTIYNASANEPWATLHLVLITETQWAIAGFSGTWTTTD